MTIVDPFIYYPPSLPPSLPPSSLPISLPLSPSLSLPPLPPSLPPSLPPFQQLIGNVGLLFTNKSKQEVIEWFANFTEQDFARAGFLATEEVVLREGPMEQFPHSVEPHLRSLGLPTVLRKGKSTLHVK